MKITATLIPSKEDFELKKISTTELPLSVSKVKTFDDCKLKYKYSYIEKLPRKEWAHFKFGKLLHDTLEHFHIALINDPHQDIRALMVSCFANSRKEYQSDKEQNKEAWDILKNYISKMEADKPETKINVLSVEKEFYIDIGGKVLLNGFIDRIQVDPDGILHVADYKTTKNKKYLKDYFQLLTYAFVLMLEDPNIQHIRTSYILLRHNFEYTTKEFSRPEVMKVSEKFIDYAEKILSEQLWRPSPTRLCGYCDFLDSCEDGRRYLEKIGASKPQFGFSQW